MDVLYLAHRVPCPPDKGERIRAYHEVSYLAARHRLHLVCFSRFPEEAAAAERIAGRCASIHVASLPRARALASAALGFALGSPASAAFYRNRRVRHYIEGLVRRFPIAVTLAYSTVMAAYAPGGIPLVLDMVDVDSEKWLAYAQRRRPGWLYAIEARRLRRLERDCAGRARKTILATSQERELLETVAPGAAAATIGNGVDTDYFDPQAAPGLPRLAGRRPLVFVGEMGYYPNTEAAAWFAREVFPGLRRRDGSLEFWIVGRNPGPALRALADREGIRVTGEVADVRPYLAAARFVVAPLRIARGIQNKVLEALAMGKPVLASPAVCRTFGKDPPPGVIRCGGEPEYADVVSGGAPARIPSPAAIREHVCRNFSWPASLAALTRELEEAAGPDAC